MATDEIRAAILRGDLLPGERLLETDLIERLGVTRFAVRRAIQELAAEGLVEVRRHRGAHVRKVSTGEAVEMTEIRMVVEGLVASRAAERVTAGQAIELDEIGTLMRHAVRLDDHRRYHDLNERLHALIRAIAGHRTADRISEGLRGVVLSGIPGRPRISLAQHERIIKAIRDRDPSAAEQAMRDHIADVIATLKSSPSL